MSETAKAEPGTDVPYEMPRAKEIQYADLGPSRKYDDTKSFAQDGTPLDVAEYERSLEQKRKDLDKEF